MFSVKIKFLTIRSGILCLHETGERIFFSFFYGFVRIVDRRQTDLPTEKGRRFFFFREPTEKLAHLGGFG